MILNKYYDDGAGDGGSGATPQPEIEKKLLQQEFDKGFNKAHAKTLSDIEKTFGMSFDELKEAFPKIQTEFEELKAKAAGANDNELQQKKLQAKYEKIEKQYNELLGNHKSIIEKAKINEQLIQPLKEAGLISSKEKQVKFLVDGMYKPKYDDATESVTIDGFDKVEDFVKSFKKDNPEYFATTQAGGVFREGLSQGNPSSPGNSIIYEGLSAYEAQTKALAGIIGK